MKEDEVKESVRRSRITLPAPANEDTRKRCKDHLPEALGIDKQVKPPKDIPEIAIQEWWAVVTNMESRNALRRLTTRPTAGIGEEAHRGLLEGEQALFMTDGDKKIMLPRGEQFKGLNPRCPDRAVGFDACEWTCLQENERVIPPGNKEICFFWYCEELCGYDSFKDLPKSAFLLHVMLRHWFCWAQVNGIELFTTRDRYGEANTVEPYRPSGSHGDEKDKHQEETAAATELCEEDRKTTAQGSTTRRTRKQTQPYSPQREDEKHLLQRKKRKRSTGEEGERRLPEAGVPLKKKKYTRTEDEDEEEKSASGRRTRTRRSPRPDGGRERERGGEEEEEGGEGEGGENRFGGTTEHPPGWASTSTTAGQSSDIDERFWLLSLMITNGHDVFPFIGWLEPRLQNRVVFINLLVKPLNMLKSEDRLAVMRLALNYTAIRGLPLRQIALQLLEDPRVKIPAIYVEGRRSAQLKPTGPYPSSTSSGGSDKQDRNPPRSGSSRADKSISGRSGQEDGRTNAPQPRRDRSGRQHDALEGLSSNERHHHQHLTLRVDFASRLSIREPASEDQGTTCVYAALFDGQAAVAKLTDEAPTTHMIYSNEKRILRRLGGRHHTVQLLASKKCVKFSYINKTAVLVFRLAQPQAQREVGPTTPKQVTTYIHHLFQALEYCHSLGIVHSDVKRDNMLWDSQRNQGTLIDFGFSKDRHSPALLRESFHGTKDYMPPEHKNSPAGDMWSAGILLSKLIHSSSHDAWRACPSLAIAPPAGTRVHAREGEEGPQMNCRALAFAGEEHARFNEAAHRLLRSLLAPDPRDRPSASQALQHDWFKFVLAASESHTDAQEPEYATSPLDRSGGDLSANTTTTVARVWVEGLQAVKLSPNYSKTEEECGQEPRRALPARAPTTSHHIEVQVAAANTPEEPAAARQHVGGEVRPCPGVTQAVPS